MSNELPDAVIAGIMGWRGPGAYTAATLRKIREVIAADRAQNPGHLEASKTAETRMDTDFAGGLLSDRAQQGEPVAECFDLDMLADACIDAEISDAKYESLCVSLSASIKAAAPAEASSEQQDMSVRVAPAPAGQHDASSATWISVDERLPNRGQQVVAYRPTAAQTNDDPVMLVRYTESARESWQGVKHGFDCICHPSHWIPLPPPPDLTSRAQRTPIDNENATVAAQREGSSNG